MSSYIYESPLAAVDIPDISISNHVLRSSITHAKQPAIIDGTNGFALNFSQLRSRIRSLAGGLQERGFQPGDVLALIAPNCPDYACVFHAAALCGGTVTTTNPVYGIAEIRQQLLDSKAIWLVADQACMAVAKQALRGTEVSHVFCLQSGSDYDHIDKLLGPEIDQVPVDFANHPVVLPYSSGTTGLPKGVMLSHRNLVANIEQMNATFEYDDHEVALAVLPFFHIFGMQALMGSMLCKGHTLITMPRFDMEQALALIEQHSVTQFFVVPPIVLGLAKSPLVDKYKLDSLKKIFSGAAPLGGELADEAGSRIGCKVVQGYGMTELSPVSHAVPGFKSKPGSSGVAVPNTQARIIDQNGKNLPPNNEGELLIKGPQVMLGYLGNPTATQEMLDSEGWLHTGDLGSIDEDGYLTLVDRVKELIKFKGFQVAPAELEALIITIPDVLDVAVIGIADEEAGEVPKAFVVLHGGSNTFSENQLEDKAANIKAVVAKNLATYKAVHHVQWIDAIPKSASGKILRRELRQLPVT